MLNDLVYYPFGVRESIKHGDRENAAKRSQIVANNTTQRSPVPERVLQFVNPEPENGGTPHGQKVRVKVPRLPFVRMVDDKGVIRELVVHSTSDLESLDADAQNSMVKTVEKKQRQGWLLLEVCPVAGGHVASDDAPCQGRHPTGCPHLLGHLKSRRINARADRKEKQAARIQGEIDKLKAQGDVIGQAIREGIATGQQAPAKDENADLKAKVAELEAMVRKLATPKPKRRRATKKDTNAKED